ncbi:hypothetical protein SAMN05443637_105122 [Pseudonocardia thermophila]|uniref:Uncharacterized protein n=1 Tax=Pseudonocardia thermophila TaxID=1848 RepID=A0A1M6RRI5_PSETH|nr:hypothetical protein [Pseudonocardia thermophila]SHK35076.1 hypothetical protein SAMN05443637_105122 [Pseudonocardia thermophila]
MTTTGHHRATCRYRTIGVSGQVLAACVVLIALMSRGPGFLGAGTAAVPPLVVGTWCLAGPFLFAAATRARRSPLETAIVFALVGAPPVLLIAGTYGLFRLLGA